MTPAEHSEQRRREMWEKDYRLAVLKLQPWVRFVDGVEVVALDEVPVDLFKEYRGLRSLGFAFGWVNDKRIEAVS